MSWTLPRQEGVRNKFPDGEYTAVIDGDWAVFTAAAAAETRSIKVIHKESGREKEFKTRTEFWGKRKARDGGWLEEANKKAKKPFTWEDFDIVDVQTPDPIENTLHTVKLMIEGVLDNLETDKLKMFLGKGTSFREHVSTALKYKGNRDGLIKPLQLQAVFEYVEKKYNATIVTGIECDEAIVIEAYGKDDHVVCGVDKDAFSQEILAFNTSKPELGVVDCRGLGELRIEGKKPNELVKGHGFLHLMYQMCSGDTADNYKANAMSCKRWGPKSAYKELVDCKSEKEAIEVAITIFKKLYPEPKVMETWRGNEVLVTWYSMMEECYQMARMHHWVGDIRSLDWLMSEYGVEYTYGQT